MNQNFDDKPKEECGVLGFYNNDNFDVARMLYYGLFALQHRGQESCGIVLNDDGNIAQVKDKGLVGEVFNDTNLSLLKGNIGVGHVKYAMASEIKENSQPLVSRYCKGTLTLSFNGNISNATEIRQDLENKGAIFQSTSGAEVIMHLAAIARTKVHSIEQAMLGVMTQLEGAYSIVVMSPRKLIGMRDPQGFRPLCIGKKGNSYILASETCALDVMRATFIRDVAPGELVMIDETGLHSFTNHCGGSPSLCIFEYIYFARPDSLIDGVSVYNTRIETGKLLAKAHPAKGDIVIGVPDSGLNFAQGYAMASGIPYGEGLIKNRYTGRTFIKQTQAEREMAVSIKLNVLKSNVAGKDIIMIDDSIVRGTTCANIIRMLKDSGAKSVHMRVASPPFLWPCYFGTDIPSKKDLIANKYTIDEICEKIGADSLGFLPIEALDDIGIRKDFGYCKACFNGDYPIHIKE